MQKPNSLRSALKQALPFFETNPDKLFFAVTNGKWRVKYSASLSFCLLYDLEILITDFVGDEALIFITLQKWLKTHQHELLTNPEKMQDGMTFEVEKQSNEASDILIKLKLSEDVKVTENPDGTITTTYLPEINEANHYGAN